MCGIAGIISVNENEIFQQRLKSMTDIIAYRGPDGEGQWISENGKVGLGHRRLSIIDLSLNARQPMHYLSRYSIIFNGEIYNYIELKQMLIKEGYSFKTESDTEVLMALYDKEKENCLSLLDGMFSFVIYDNEKDEIFATRDRFGEKPFYYSYEPGKRFIFGSEMKCLWAAGIKKDVNNRMLFSYLNYGSLQNQKDESETFYNNCTNLPHGYYLKLPVSSCILSIKKYYDINLANINHIITETQAQDKFRELIYTSVKRRLRSDVTVGSSLSGGLDSSLIVCVIDQLRKGTQQKQNTFSAIFPGFEKDERKYIDYVIEGRNIFPHFTTPDGDGIIKDFEKLIWHQEEPFGTASIYAQYCVMRLAKENNVTVLLDGQGADEYLAGYHSYYHQFFNDLKKNYPKSAQSQYNSYLDLHGANTINPIMKRDLKYMIRMKIPKALKTAKNLMNYYYHKKESFYSDEFYFTNIKNNGIPYQYPKDLNSALYHNIFHGELQNLLRFCDRNSMSQSREVRLPFLYNELVEFLFSLPPYFKINNGWTKWILRTAFTGLLPQEIVWRKDKIGYEPPQINWLKNKKVEEKIYESRRILYKHNIISKKEFERNTSLKSNPGTNNKNWEVWMAGEMFK
ncbi:MAG TPA: asparagine synthase (glutamine-hydrolyzing) [Hanamia sp.]|nr:asparagine synthase (glutamine-hydrolyzing) [Hanamia sp.]